MDITTVEMVSYRFKADVTRAQIEATFEGVNQLLNQQPGFYYRSMSCNDQGEWYDLAFWKNMDCAKAGGDAFMASAAGQALVALIDNDTLVMHQMPVATEVSAEMAAA